MPAATHERAFGAQDFISFDFRHDPNDETPEAFPPPKKGRGARARDNEDADRKGKKRKADEREDDGRSKKEREMARSRHTPWSADVEWNKCQNGAEALHREVIAFDHWMAPTAAEHDTRCMVIELISRAIKSQFRDAEVHPFGSQETKLYLPQGDLDLVVVSRSMANLRTQSALRSMAACLRRHNLATDVQVIAKAKVPIIKFVTTYARLKVDISLNHTNGLTTASYVNSWLRKWPHIRPLILVVKHLLVQRGMSEVFSGGLGSYSVIIMVISFLQLHPKVQRGEIEPARSLGVLLLEFLELYGKNFGYDNCGISIRGRGGYFSKARRGWKDERRPFMLCIEDPHDPSNDISKGSFGIINVRSTLAGAFDILTAAICQQANEGSSGGRGASNGTSKGDSGRNKHRRFSVDSDSDSDAEARRALVRDSTATGGKDDKDPNSLLGTILGISNPVVRQRKEMEELFYSGSLQFKLGRPAPPSSPPPARPSSSRDQQVEPRISGSSRPSSSSQPSSKSKPRDDGSGIVSISDATSSAKGGKMPTLSIRGAASAANAAQKEASASSERGTKRRAAEPSTSAGSDLSRQANKAEEDEEEEDSRYSASRSTRAKSTTSRRGENGDVDSSAAPATKRARASKSEITQADLEDLSQSAPSTFVSEDDSDDELARQDVYIELPTLSTSSSAKSSPKPSGGARGLSRISSRTKNDFWTAKGVDTQPGEPSVSPPPVEVDGDGDGADE